MERHFSVSFPQHNQWLSFRRQWLPNLKEMEINGSKQHAHAHGHQPSADSNNANKVQSTEKEVFVNHAAITWHEIRRQWVGDKSQKSKRISREPIMRCPVISFMNLIWCMKFKSPLYFAWTTTYEDLLCSTEPFQQPIPLTEMVDFLVDIWHEEGLYD
ncbi:hypothetical protein COLO4_09332 [Corchorus olitorius]|uniref:Gag1-like clamp domain-containing protein n=1 Tax=Corchorus olitorius TaxID=93759 RepID=A0A1R3KCC8_9ROSI|nr:hypothetical protein COLO4_09332 [Corchorus olitorius]